MEEKQIDNQLDEAVEKEEKEKIEAEEKEINDRKLFASEIAKEMTEQLKPMFEKTDYSEIIEAINAIEVNPIVSVKSPVIELKERKIEVPKIKLPKAERPIINLRPEIKVKASDVKFPAIININGFRDFAKTIIEALKNKIRVTASKENPLPVQLVYEKKFYEAMGGGGGPSKIWLKNTEGIAINPATEDTLSDINEKVINHDGHIQTLGYHEGIGHLSTNGDIKVERAMGRKTGIGEGAFTLLEEAAFVQPAGDTQMYIESASANDASAGTGVQQITIEYFSAAWGQRKTTTVLMNGTTQVTLSVSDIYRIHKMYANRVGSSGVAVGLIKLTNQAEDVLYGQISQYHAFMQRCIFYVAENETLTCTEAAISSYSKEGIIARVFASEEDDVGNVVPRARMVCELVNGALSCPFVISETVKNPNNKRIAIGLAVTGVAAAQSATGTLKGFSKPEV